MIYETERLIVDIPGKDFAESAQRFYLDNKELGLLWDPPLPEFFTTIEYQREILEKDVKGFDDGFETRFWFFLKAEPDVPIGYCLVQRVVRTDSQASCIMGYFLDKRYHKKGYMKEALDFILELLFTDYLMQRVCIYIQPENEPSIRLAKALGFEYEGLTKSYLFHNDQWKDHACYAMIRPEKYGKLDPR